MSSKLWPKIRKLMLALKQQQGKIYMVNREQIYSTDKDKVCTVMVLNRLTPVYEYNKEHPGKERNPSKQDFVKERIASSFRESDILLALVAAYKGGERSG